MQLFIGSTQHSVTIVAYSSRFSTIIQRHVFSGSGRLYVVSTYTAGTLASIDQFINNNLIIAHIKPCNIANFQPITIK